MGNRFTNAQNITFFILLVSAGFLPIALDNTQAVLSEWKVRWWWPFGQDQNCPGLLCFANQQMKLEKGEIPVDPILSPQKGSTEYIHVYVIDQTAPDVKNTKQNETFHDFNKEVEKLCDSRFAAFMIDAPESRKAILRNPFHEAVAFYIVANAIVQNEKIKFCVLDYFGSNQTPFSNRFKGGSHIINCSKSARARLCAEFILGPKNPPFDALDRSNFDSLLTNFQNRLVNIIRDENSNNLPLEITFISDFVHEKEPSKGRGRHISIDEVRRAFSKLLSVCPEIKSMNFVKLPMRINDSNLEADQQALLMSFGERFKNGETQPDIIESDRIGGSTELIEHLNIYSVEGFVQTKPIRAFVPYSDGRFNDVGKGVFSVAAIANKVEYFQFCLESPSGEINMEITMPDEDSTFRVHVPNKPELVKVKRPKSDNFTMSFTAIEGAEDRPNLVLRVVAPRQMPTEQLKYENISLPIRLVPRMPHFETSVLGYVTVMILVGFLFWTMLFLSARAFLKPAFNDWLDRFLGFFYWLLTWNIKARFKLNLLWAFLPAGFCYLLMSRCLPDFPFAKELSIITLVITGFIGYLHLRSLERHCRSVNY